jgi:starch synthase
MLKNCNKIRIFVSLLLINLSFMTKKRILFISQEIAPYTEENEISKIGRYLPQGIQEKGKEIRTFMPRFGSINERRNQLHEVIRLSGMNLIINENDHPLIIKVASIQPARMQVYFIDNEDFFQRKATFEDKKGTFFEDNDERSIFFCRGVLETVKKLGWAPDLVHCHGWMTSLIPMFLKTAYKDEPLFENTKVVYSAYDDEFENSLNNDFAKKALMEGIDQKDLGLYMDPTHENITKAAISWSDAAIIGSQDTNKDLIQFIEESGKPMLTYQSEDKYVETFSNFYDEILTEEEVLTE